MENSFKSDRHAVVRVTGGAALVAGCAMVLAASLHGQRFASLPGTVVDEAKLSNRSIAVGDVDGNGWNDLVVSGFAPGLKHRTVLALGRGDGRFEVVPSPNFRVPARGLGYRRILLRDIDGDGDLDVLLWQLMFAGGNQQATLMRNDGRGRFTDVTATALPTKGGFGMASVAFVDFDGDGDPDLLQAGLSIAATKTTLWENDGKGRFRVSTRSLIALSPFGADLRVHDVDGDGDEDIFALGVTSRLYLNLGRGRWADAGTRWPNKVVVSAASLVDIDRDGDVDVFGYSQGDARGVLLRNQKGAFAVDISFVLPLLTPNFVSSHATDIDGDTWSDLVVRQSGSDAPFLLRNDRGKGLTLDRDPPGLPSSLLGGVFADLDHDGDDDFVGGLPSAPTLLHANLHRQVAVSPEATRGGTLLYFAFATRTASTAFLPIVSAKAIRPTLVPKRGVLALDLNGAVLLPPLVVPRGAGKSGVALRIPSIPGLRDLRLFTQCFVVPDGTVSNRASVFIR